MKAWLKGGLIVGALGLLYSVLPILLDSIASPLFIPIAWIYIIFGFLLFNNSSISPNLADLILKLLIVILFTIPSFVIGAVIGLIVGEIKSGNKL